MRRVATTFLIVLALAVSIAEAQRGFRGGGRGFGEYGVPPPLSHRR